MNYKKLSALFRKIKKFYKLYIHVLYKSFLYLCAWLHMYVKILLRYVKPHVKTHYKQTVTFITISCLERVKNQLPRRLKRDFVEYRYTYVYMYGGTLIIIFQRISAEGF